MFNYPLSVYIGHLRSRVNYFFSSSRKSNHKLFNQLQEQGLTLLSKYALNDLYIAVKNNAQSNKVAGAIIEAGCAKGGSSVALAIAKSDSTPLLVYDVFGLIPPPSERDDQGSIERYKEIATGKAVGIANNKYYGYEENLYDKVSQSFEDFGIDLVRDKVQLVQGLYQDTLQISFPVALAHIDCDWYDSVMTCLERIHPFLVIGGTFIIDDYFAYGGCKDAVNDFFADKRDQYEFKFLSRLHIVKICGS
jgi:hypothetical protein